MLNYSTDQMFSALDVLHCRICKEANSVMLNYSTGNQEPLLIDRMNFV